MSLVMASCNMQRRCRPEWFSVTVMCLLVMGSHFHDVFEIWGVRCPERVDLRERDGRQTVEVQLPLLEFLQSKA